MAWITLDHHGGRLEDRHGDFSHRQLLVVGLLCRDDRRIRGQHEVDAGVRHQIGLELSDVHVQGSIEAQRCGQTGNDLGNEAVEVGVRGAFNVQVPQQGFSMPDRGLLSKLSTSQSRS